MKAKQKPFRSQVAKRLVGNLPKTADGFSASLGMLVFYPYSLDSFAGPHEVVITKMSATYGWFMGSEDNRDVEIGVEWANLYYCRRNIAVRKSTVA